MRLTFLPTREIPAQAPTPGFRPSLIDFAPFNPEAVRASAFWGFTFSGGIVIFAD